MRKRSKFEKRHGLFPGTRLLLRDGREVVYEREAGTREEASCEPELRGRWRRTGEGVAELLGSDFVIVERQTCLVVFTLACIASNWGYDAWARARESEAGVDAGRVLEEGRRSWLGAHEAHDG